MSTSCVFPHCIVGVVVVVDVGVVAVYYVVVVRIYAIVVICEDGVVVSDVDVGATVVGVGGIVDYVV